MIGPYQNALASHVVSLKVMIWLTRTLFFPPLPASRYIVSVLASSSDWFITILVEIVFIISQNRMVSWVRQETHNNSCFLNAVKKISFCTVVKQPISLI